jgi:hypothetical protein
MTEKLSRRAAFLGATVTLALAVALPGAFADGPGNPERAEPAIAAASNGAATTIARASVQGTIEATVDGRRITWYSVSGESGGRPYSSSSWMELSSGVRVVAVGGFATDEPPLESFEWDASGMPASYGDYDGSIIGIAIQLAGQESSSTVSFPDAGGITAMTYQPTATLQNVMATTFMVSEGTLSVSSIEVSGGLASARGTFSGTFRTMQGDGVVEITDGVFDLEGIPSVESIRR